MHSRILAAIAAALSVVAATVALPAVAVAAAASGWLPAQTVGNSGGVRGVVPSVTMNARGDAAVVTPSPLGVFTRPAGGTAFGALAPPVTDAGSATVGGVDVGLGDNGTVLLGLSGLSSGQQLATGPLGGPLGAPIPISADTYSEIYEPQVAAGADGTVVATWSANVAGKRVVRWTIRPPGGAFGPAHGSDPALYATLGNLSVDRAGHTLITYTLYDIDSDRYDLWTVSRDPGGDFGAPQRISTDDDLLPFNGWDNVGTIAHDGAAAVVFSTTRTSPERLLLVERASSSAPWSRRTTLATGSTLSREIVANDRGDLLVGYASDQPGGYRTIAQTGRLGGSVDAPVDLGRGFSLAPSIAEDGTAAVAFIPYLPPLLVTRKAPDGGWSAPERIDDPGDPTQVSAGSWPSVTLASDADGDLVAGWATDAGIYRVRPFDGAAPHLNVTELPTAPSLGVPASFAATATDFTPTTVAWDFGDGGRTTGPAVGHTYARPGMFTVKVTATDAVGHATTVTRTVAVAAITVPAKPAAKPTARPRCAVPTLTNHTLAGAKAMLKRAHCALGKATTPKRLKGRKGLVVRSQSRKAKTKASNGAKVSVTLGVKPKPKKKATRK
jgi:PKD domain